MTNLDELFKSIALSVLNNTSIVTDDKLNIEPNKQEYVLAFINEALTRLHSRFILKTNSIYVEMHEGRTSYPLLARFAFTQFNPEKVQYPFIMDSYAYPFQEDVIKVLTIYDNQGNQRSINDNNSPHGLFTPRPDTVQCIRPRHGEVISISYQAKHPRLYLGEDEVMNQAEEIDIPETLLPALKYWVAYSYYTGLNTAETTGKAAEYLQMYESICKEVEDFDLANGSASNTNVLFERRGWI